MYLGGYQIQSQPQLCSKILYRKEREERGERRAVERREGKREGAEQSSSLALPHFDNRSPSRSPVLATGNNEETKHSNRTEKAQEEPQVLVSRTNYINRNEREGREGRERLGYHTVALLLQRAHQSPCPPQARAQQVTFNQSLKLFVLHGPPLKVDLQCHEEYEEELVVFIQASHRVSEDFIGQVLDDVRNSFLR